MTANRIKRVSYAYILLAPFAAFCTAVAFRREKDRHQRARNRRIARQLFSAPVLLGETLIVEAHKLPSQPAEPS